jgi:putative ABC transport system permease protein
MTIDGSVLFAVGLGGLAGTILLSALPLMLAGRSRLSASLRRAGSATTDAPGMRRLRSGMLVFEVAATLVLLVTCGLLLRSVVAMTNTELGFDASRLQRARIELRSADYRDATAYTQFFRRFTEQAVTSIGGPVVFSSWPPFAEFPERALEVDDRAGHVMNAGAVNVGPGYLATLGIRLHNGRDISWDDVSESAPVAVVSESVARRLWPADSAIGKRIRQIEITAGGARPPGPWRTVVGVAADVRQAYGDENVHDIYTPWLPDVRFGSFYLRADRTGASLNSALAAVAAEIDPHAVVDLIRPVESENRELSGASFLAILLGAFAGVAGVVAAIGIYGVTAYSVQQREREVAIRVALGADRGAVTWQFLRESGVVVMAGLVLGVGGGIAAARALRNQVFGVEAFDPGTLLAMSFLLAAACLLATWVPSRRASAKDPAAALKDV